MVRRLLLGGWLPWLELCRVGSWVPVCGGWFDCLGLSDLCAVVCLMVRLWLELGVVCVIPVFGIVLLLVFC